jgi:hypothetical protein
VEEAFEELVDGSEDYRREKQNAEATGEGEDDARQQGLRVRGTGGRRRSWAEQAFDASGKIAIVSEKGRGEIRKARAGAQARDAHERSGQRNGAERVSGSGFVIGGPLGEFRPIPFQSAERAEEREAVRGEKEEQTLEVVARGTVSELVRKRDFELFGVEFAQDRARDEQLRAEQTGEREKRSIALDDGYAGSCARRLDARANRGAKTVVAGGSGDGTKGAQERDKTCRGAEKSEEHTEETDALGGTGGLEPQVTGNAKSKNKNGGESRGRNAQGKKEASRQAGGLSFRKADGEF